MSKREKQRCLLGLFPVWLQLEDINGRELNEVTGFWSDLALNIDLTFDFICHYASFGTWEREGFSFYPYESNGCKNWFQAIYKIL